MNKISKVLELDTQGLEHGDTTFLKDTQVSDII